MFFFEQIKMEHNIKPIVVLPTEGVLKKRHTSIYNVKYTLYVNTHTNERVSTPVVITKNKRWLI